MAWGPSSASFFACLTGLDRPARPGRAGQSMGLLRSGEAAPDLSNHAPVPLAALSRQGPAPRQRPGEASPWGTLSPRIEFVPGLVEPSLRSLGEGRRC